MGAMKRWEAGLPVLGYESHPVKWAYVGSDRSLRGTHRTIRDLGIDPASINIIPAWGKDRLTLNQIFDRGASLGAELLVIEGFGGFPETDAGQGIKSFLCSVQASIDRSGITILGVVESPKMKPYERYENPRQRVSGAAAWAHHTETIIIIEATDPKAPMEIDRSLYLCPRNGASQTFESAFTPDGKLVFGPEALSPLESIQGGELISKSPVSLPRGLKSKGVN